MTERRAREPVSLRTLFWRRFSSNPLAVTGLAIMISAILAAVVGPHVIATDPNTIGYTAINA
ncbi:MAG: hypothetical protein C4345_12630, partial [Chloroflexota bacterium]